MTPELREKMGKDAVASAKAVDYVGAGTIEFLVDDNHNYYFLEMNTRLQVEHPITERVIGIDLVKEQINIANGMKLSRKQEDIQQRGHSFECRIYAEDPDNNFMPSPGLIKHITEPLGLGVRTDGYVYEGYNIPLFYDPLISKLVIWATTREESLTRMKRALHEYKITGVKTSIRFLERIFETPDFVQGKYDTHFIQNNEEFLFSGDDCDQQCKDMAVITAYIDFLDKITKTKVESSSTEENGNWKNFGRRNGIQRL